ncbi:MAG: polysaccharide pyruvyl transferase family protein [Bacteroidales bacterium]|nr:polysaccharide pyruvyl transferase family protein [Bacteroidales bacterium]
MMRKKKQKIGIVTWFGSYNIGTNLQAYALHEVLNNMGFDAALLHLVVNPAKRKSLFHRLYLLLRRCFIPLRPAARYVLFEIPDKQRYRNTFRFLRNHVSVYDLDSFCKYDAYSDKFCCAISGSDQIWNPYYVNDYHLLSFASDKIAYSSSLGVSFIPEDKKAKYLQHLPSFKSIAVREDTGNRLLRELLQRQDIQTVLDPVFLLPASRWEALADSVQLPMPATEPYILCYLVGENDYYAAQVQRIRQQLGVNRVCVVTARANHANHIDGEYCEWAGPAEFLALKRNAAYVVTDSFHSTVLCLLMHKNFVALTRFRQNDGKSQHSRMTDLLSKFHLTDKLYQESDTNWHHEIDFKKVDVVLEQERATSMDYLTKALSPYAE